VKGAACGEQKGLYALRLHEAKMIKSGPNKLPAVGTDWRFLDELKKEPKA
jgi:NitT/TauT family transport system substrate-binding protein